MSFVITRNADGSISITDAELDSNIATLLEETYIIERHLHANNYYMGARALWDGTNQNQAASNASMTPFVVDAGNDTWGDSYCILGDEDTPVFASRTHYDIRLVTIRATEKVAPYRLRIAFGTAYVNAVANGHYSEIEITPQVGVIPPGPILTSMYRMPAGVKVFAAAWCYGEDTGTISFTYGLHEYVE